MSLNRIWIYFFVSVIIPHCHLPLPRERLVIGALETHYEFDYPNLVERSFNNYDENFEQPEIEYVSNEDELAKNVMPNRQAFSNNWQNDHSNIAGFELAASTTCEPSDSGTSSKDMQEIIDRVTVLIKVMREHIIEVLNNMNQLETELLPGGDEMNKDVLAGCGNGGNDRFGGMGDFNTSTERKGGNGNVYCKEHNGNLGGNDYSSNKVGIGNTGGGLNDSSTNCEEDDIITNKKNYENPNKLVNIKSNKDFIDNATSKINSCITTHRYRNDVELKHRPLGINEFTVPMRSEDTTRQSAQELVSHAKKAVHSWKSQIDSCKRILDDAVEQAIERETIANFIKNNLNNEKKKSEKNHINTIQEDISEPNPYPYMDLIKSLMLSKMQSSPPAYSVSTEAPHNPTTEKFEPLNPQFNSVLEASGVDNNYVNLTVTPSPTLTDNNLTTSKSNNTKDTKDKLRAKTEQRSDGSDGDIISDMIYNKNGKRSFFDKYFAMRSQNLNKWRV